jgi:DNA-binding NarL/FixJ family response regulator
MLALVQAKILIVGLNGRTEALRELPIQFIEADFGVQAARYLKNERVDACLCAWNLLDMPNGLFLRKLRIVKPDIKTIVVVKAGDFQQEIEARSLGASAVVTDRSSDEFFSETVAAAVGLTSQVAHKQKE